MICCASRATSCRRTVPSIAPWHHDNPLSDPTYKRMNILDAIHDRPLLADGAMGTVIYSRGIDFEQSFDELNLLRPDLILDIHRAYAAAGADILETNTFSAVLLF